MPFLPEHMTRIFLNEAFRHRRMMVAMFVLIAVAFLLVGLVWPKGYSVYTTILVDEKNIIQPLMQGAAVTTEIADRSRMAREVIFGRKIHEPGDVRDRLAGGRAAARRAGADPEAAHAQNLDHERRP